MTDQPDLTAELDDAGQIISGEVEKVVVEWGVRHDDDGTDDVYQYANEVEARRGAAIHGDQATAVWRKVTYGKWTASREGGDGTP